MRILNLSFFHTARYHTFDLLKLAGYLLNKPLPKVIVNNPIHEITRNKTLLETGVGLVLPTLHNLLPLQSIRP